MESWQRKLLSQARERLEAIPSERLEICDPAAVVELALVLHDVLEILEDKP